MPKRTAEYKWRVTKIRNGLMYVWPVDEEKLHDLENECCVCVPAIFYENGGKVISHNRLSQEEPKCQI